MTISRHTLFAVAALMLVLGVAAPANAKIASLDEAKSDLILGDANAPVEVVEYASLSCPACRGFHETVFPKLKEQYIDTGKIRFRFVDFPTNSAGMAAAMIARCAGPTKHQGMIDLFFDSQSQWGRAENPLEAMTMIARMAGLGPNDVDECVKNTELYNFIRDTQQKASEELGVNATPTVFVAGEKLEDSDFETVKTAIDKALAK